VHDDGTIGGFFALADTDPTHMERALDEERQSARRLAEQLRIVSRVSTALHDMEPQRVQDAVADAVLELGYDGANLALINRVNGTFVPSHGRGPFAAFEGIEVPLSQGATHAVLEAEDIVVLADYQCSPVAVGRIRDSGVRTSVSVPVRVGGAIVAVLHAGSMQVRTIADSDRELLSLLADIAGTALYHAQRYEQSQVRTNHLALVAETDALTGIGNRLAAEQMLEATQPGDVLAIVDLDHFKLVNDERGHAIGDDTLRGLAGLLAASLRDHDQVARLGGDEFLILLPATELSVADGIFERLAASWLATAPFTTFSAGIARSRLSETSRLVYERADSALYLAKRRGRNRVVTEDALA
jgi:diguanylate cyclase (GGDEF)-like protein